MKILQLSFVFVLSVLIMIISSHSLAFASDYLWEIGNPQANLQIVTGDSTRTLMGNKVCLQTLLNRGRQVFGFRTPAAMQGLNFTGEVELEFFDAGIGQIELLYGQEGVSKKIQKETIAKTNSFVWKQVKIKIVDAVFARYFDDESDFLVVNDDPAAPLYLRKIAFVPLEMYKELVDNGDFEDGLWGGVCPTAKLDYRNVFSGNAAARMEATTIEQYLSGPNIPVDPQKIYVFSVYVKTSGLTTDKDASIQLLQINKDLQSGAGWYVVGETGPRYDDKERVVITGKTQDWQRYEIMLDNLAPGTSFVRPYLRLAPGERGTVWFDRVSMRESDLQFFNGWKEKNNIVVINQSTTNIPITIHNLRDSPQILRGRLRIVDARGSTVLDREYEIQVAPKSESPSPFLLPADIVCTPNTYYYAQVQIANAQGTLQYKADIGMITAGGKPTGLLAQFAGINTHGFDERIGNFLKATGFGMARVDFNWRDIEPQKGNFTWEKADSMVEKASAAGIELLPVLCHAPKWAQREGRPWPRDSAEYANFVRAVAARYKGKIRYWEIWNEPDYLPVWGATIEDYYQMLRAAYTAIKEVDPNALVIGGGGVGNLEYLTQLFALGAKDYMDILSIHLYTRPKSPEEAGWVKSLAAFKNLATQNKVESVWLTEIGWPTATDASSVSEDKQAQYLVRSLLLAMGSGYIDRYFWYQLGSGASNTDPEMQYGILKYNSAPKPAFLATINLSQVLGKAKFSANLNLSPTLYAQIFEEEGNPLLILWNTSPQVGTAWLDVPPQQVKAVFVTGQEISFATSEKGVKIPLSGTPILLRLENSEEGDRVGWAKALLQKAKIEGITPLRLASTRAVRGEKGQVILEIEIENQLNALYGGNVLLESLPAGWQAENMSSKFQVEGGEKARIRFVIRGDQVQSATDSTLKLRVENTGGEDTLDFTWALNFAVAEQTTVGLKVDGDLQEWGQLLPLTLGTTQQATFLPQWGGEKDLSAKVWWMWDEVNLYFAAVVEDNVFRQTQSGGNTWLGDGFQIAFDTQHDGGITYAGDDYEYGFALTPNGPEVYRWAAARGLTTGLVKKAMLAIRRIGTQVIYEAAIPWTELVPFKPEKGALMGLSLLINDDDGQGRRGWLEWSSGIGSSKNPNLFGTLLLK